MNDRAHRALRRIVGVTKVAVLGSLAVLVLVVAHPSPGPSETPSPSAAESAEVAALMQRYDCSTSGLDDDVIPGSALVRQGEQVSLVSFDRGWATFTGEAEGTLVAVCP